MIARELRGSELVSATIVDPTVIGNIGRSDRNFDKTRPTSLLEAELSAQNLECVHVSGLNY